MMLPQAKIIDIRREPMAACFAMYKQLYCQTTQGFSYDLDELGRYYNNYVSLIEHWRSVLPGRIHYVQYERLVEDTETARSAACWITAAYRSRKPACASGRTERTVATPSAGQVRQPIFRDAMQQWRNFEPWLGSSQSNALDQSRGSLTLTAAFISFAGKCGFMSGGQQPIGPKRSWRTNRSRSDVRDRRTVHACFRE